MCVIVNKPAGSDLPRHVVEKSLDANPYGWGLAWTAPHTDPEIKDGKPVWWYIKGMDDADCHAAVDQYVTKDNLAVLHCRIASVGKVGIANTHPFRMPKSGMLLCHNGTMSSFPTVGGCTDSEAFGHWLDKMENLSTLLLNKRWRKSLDTLISPSKMAIMGHKGNGDPIVHILGHSRGCTQGKLWASNNGAFVANSGYWVGTSHYSGSVKTHGKCNGKCGNDVYDVNYHVTNCGHKPTDGKLVVLRSGILANREAAEWEADACADCGTNFTPLENGASTRRCEKCIVKHLADGGKALSQEVLDDLAEEQKYFAQTSKCRECKMYYSSTCETCARVRGTTDKAVWDALKAAQEDEERIKALEGDIGPGEPEIAAMRFEAEKSVEDLCEAVTEDPKAAALALWFYRSMFVGA